MGNFYFCCLRRGAQSRYNMSESNDMPGWLKEGGKPPFTCWICGGSTAITFSVEKINIFSICETCNPTKMIDYEIMGCEAVCRVCLGCVLYDACTAQCKRCMKIICSNCEPKNRKSDDYYCSEKCANLK